MSQYLNLFARVGDRFIPLASYSRNCLFYQVMRESINPPYEKVKSLSIEQLGKVRDIFAAQQKDVIMRIQHLHSKKRIIASFNNSVEDKLEALVDCDSAIEDWKIDLAQRQEGENICNFLIDMIESIKYGEDKGFDDIFYNNYIYCGIEVGCDITPDDIVKE